MPALPALPPDPRGPAASNLHHKYVSVLMSRQAEGDSIPAQLEAARGEIASLQNKLAAAEGRRMELSDKLERLRAGERSGEAFVCGRCFRSYPVWADRLVQFKCVCGATALRQRPPAG